MKTAMKSIRAYCIECGDGTYKEVRLCPVRTCPLFPYRFGRGPSKEIRNECEQALKDHK